jgi:quinoprotein glucose dehydrogenase
MNEGTMRWITLLATTVMASTAQRIPSEEWHAYGHDGGGTRHASLSQINRENVKNLRVAWTYHSGDLFPGGSSGKPSAFETTPLYIGGRLYITTAFGRVLALDPVSGKELWSYDPKVDVRAGFGDFANRGASTWSDPRTRERRIYIATVDAHLIALIAATGKPAANFGDNGVVNLRSGLRMPPKEPWEYEETSPPAIVDDLVIVGSGIADNSRADMASGEVRAFDARTGKVRWSWDPAPGTRMGAANAWSVISVDPERRLVFVPTGSPSPDYYGGLRPGANLYANSVVALQAATGKLVWHFQTVHHDLWDYDVASQPVLITVKQNRRDIPAVAVGSKTGHVFILHRETGKPVFGVEERSVPKSNVEGEDASPTQPFPVMPRAVAPQRVTESDLWGRTPEDEKWCRETFAGLRSEGIFTPPSLGGSLQIPGNIGGAHWGSAAYDPVRRLLVIPANNIPSIVRLIPQADFDTARRARLGPEYARQSGAPFGVSRTFFISPAGSPCIKPPWGTLTAINADTGEQVWNKPFGAMTALNFSDPNLGSLNLGGLITTAGGLIFATGTLDAKLHAYDSDTGSQLWSGTLPTTARAAPMTFRGPDGRQYVVIAAGGHDIAGIPQGDSLVAFRLP